jgi:CRP-like cAMP-binding protein
MLTSVINNPKAAQYRKEFAPGLFVFREADDSQDMYILVSGALEVLKGDRVISRMTEPGTVF